MIRPSISSARGALPVRPPAALHVAAAAAEREGPNVHFGSPRIGRKPKWRFEGRARDGSSGRSVAEPLPEVVVFGDLEDDRALAPAALTPTPIRASGGQQVRRERIGLVRPPVAGVPQFVKVLDSQIELIEGCRRESIDTTRALRATNDESARPHPGQMFGDCRPPDTDGTDAAPSDRRRCITVSGHQLTGRAFPSSYPAALWKPTTARSWNAATSAAPA